MVVQLSETQPDEFLAGRLRAGLHLLLSQYLIWLGLYILLAGILPITVAVLVWMGGSPREFGTGACRLLFPMVLIGIIIGRILMFELVARS
jgi:hypothetical protein